MIRIWVLQKGKQIFDLIFNQTCAKTLFFYLQIYCKEEQKLQENIFLQFEAQNPENSLI